MTRKLTGGALSGPTILLVLAALGVVAVVIALVIVPAVNGSSKNAPGSKPVGSCSSCPNNKSR